MNVQSYHSSAQAEVFQTQKTINCAGKLINLEKGALMGILNLTPDSFFSESRIGNDAKFLQKAEQLINEGADFLDLGGYSTRPGADDVPEEEELKRVVPAIELLHRKMPEVLISIDTFRSKVAREAVAAGACLINDVSGGEEDADMFSTVAELNVPYVLMHRKGTPKTMQQNPQYEDVVKEVIQYLSAKLFILRQLHVKDVIIDPGFGFGKNLGHNYTLLKNLSLLNMLGCPLMVGVSRKGMIHRLLKISAEEALNGTTVVHSLALQQSPAILRVHDVKAAKEVLDIVNFYRESV